MNKQCVICKEEATYDAPDPLCEQHWAEWWVDGLTDDPIERKKLLRETLANIKHWNKNR